MGAGPDAFEYSDESMTEMQQVVLQWNYYIKNKINILNAYAPIFLLKYMIVLLRSSVFILFPSASNF